MQTQVCLLLTAKGQKRLVQVQIIVYWYSKFDLWIGNDIMGFKEHVKKFGLLDLLVMETLFLSVGQNTKFRQTGESVEWRCCQEPIPN